MARMGVNEAEEAPLGELANAESQADEETDPEEEWNEMHEDWEDEAGPWEVVVMDDADVVLTEAKERFLVSRLTWNVTFATQKETRITAAWNAWHMKGQFWKAKVDFKFKCNVCKATIQGALLSGLCASAGQHESFTENELFPLEGSQIKLARRLLEKLGRRAEQAANRNQSPASKPWEWCQSQRSSESDAQLEPRGRQSKFKTKRLVPPVTAGGNFLTDAPEQIPLHDERWEVEARPLSGGGSLSNPRRTRKSEKKSQPGQGAVQKGTGRKQGAKFDHFVDKEKTADAINDFILNTVTSAAQALLAKRLEDEEEWSDGTSEAKER